MTLVQIIDSAIEEYSLEDSEELRKKEYLPFLKRFTKTQGYDITQYLEENDPRKKGEKRKIFYVADVVQDALFLYLCVRGKQKVRPNMRDEARLIVTKQQLTYLAAKSGDDGWEDDNLRTVNWRRKEARKRYNSQVNMEIPTYMQLMQKVLQDSNVVKQYGQLDYKTHISHEGRKRRRVG